MAETPPIYLTALNLEDVRCFSGCHTLDLTDNGRPARWSLLIGENGAGKTTLLESLAWMRPVPVVSAKSAVSTDLERTRYPNPLVEGRLQPALFGEENEVLETIPRVGTREVNLSAQFSYGVSLGPEGERSRGKNISLGIQLSFDEGELLHDVKPKRSQIKTLGNAFHDPLIVSYGANRYLGNRNSLGINEPSLSDYERLSKCTELYDVEEILTTLDYAGEAKHREPERSSLGRLIEVITRIIPDDHIEIEIYPPDILDIGQRSGVYAKTFAGMVRMSALSLGHRTTSGWVMDLAWRFLNRYRESSDPLAEPAVVLIDEIDLHMHPRWQRHIMTDLSKLFPATQFIATSHSPLIVQAADQANLVLLRKREGAVEIVNDPGVPRNLRVDQILTSLLFGMPSARSDRVQGLFDQRAELLKKTNRSQDEEERLRSIRRQIDELPTAEDRNDQAAMDRIRQFAALLEDNQGTRL